MNKFEHLNSLITESFNSYDPNEIVEITSIEDLLEASGSPAIQGYAGSPLATKKINKKFNEDEKERSRVKGKKLTKEGNEMINRESIIVERMLRKHIRRKIKHLMHEQKKSQLQEEMQLRQIIRQMLKEGDISDIHPHRSTGINVLEDLLKKMIPTLRTDYKRLTTDESQRKSFRAHLVKAIKDSLMPMMVNDKFKPGAEIEAGGALLSAPVEEPEVPDEPEEMEAEEDLANLEEEFQILDELDIEVGPEDEEKKVPIEDDDTPSEEEAFGAGLEGLDETGRNMAFTCFKKVSQYILDAYDSLANPKDKEIFIDYLVTNVKLYFDKFEDELQKSVDEPTTDEYESAKV